MKIKKLFKSICLMIILVVAVFGLSACGDKLPSGAKIVNAKIYVVNTWKENLRFFVYPTEKTGQSIDILSLTIDTDKWTVETSKLYEDGKLVDPGLNTSDFPWQIVVNIKHTEPGTHSYFVEYLYTNGKVRRTETRTIKFSGKIEDYHPWHAKIKVRADFLDISAHDYGDNKGIVSAEIYENGELYKTLYNTDYALSGYYRDTVLLDLEKTGKYEYYVWFKDKGGNKTKSRTIIVDYQ